MRMLDIRPLITDLLPADVRSFRAWSRAFSQDVVQDRRAAVETEISSQRAATNKQPAGSGSSQWATWTQCSRTCGGGTRTRSLLCQGSPCPGAKPKTEHCNTQLCDLGRNMNHKTLNIKLTIEPFQLQVVPTNGPPGVPAVKPVGEEP